VATVRGRERYATNLRNRLKGRRGSRSYYYCYLVFFIMPLREPPNLWNERRDSAGSSHRNDGSAHVFFGLFVGASVVLGACAPFSSFASHVRYNGHSRNYRNVFLQDARSPLLPLIRRESPYYWVLPLTRSPKSEPIMQNRARRSMARDSNNRSVIRQLSWILCRFFPTFTDPSYNSLLLSGLRNRAPHKIPFRAPVLEELIFLAAAKSWR